MSRTAALSPQPTPAGVAAIYVRLSQDREGAGLGVARQEVDCRPLCEERGYSPERIRVYCDNDLSAYVVPGAVAGGKVRPRFRDLLRDLEAGQITFVAAWHTDRLYRSIRDLGHLVEVTIRMHVDVETVRAGAVDLSTPTGRLIANNLASIAGYESEHKAERHRRAEVELALHGKAHGGRRPFGYEADRVTIRPVEAELVREVGRRAIAGESLHALTHELARRGVTTPDVKKRDGSLIKGQPWSITGLRKLLVSGRVAGQREHLGKVVAKAEWPAIISAEDSERLHAVLGRPNLRGRGTGNRPTRYLLSGLVVCGLCGTRLVARPASGRRSMSCVSDPRRGGCGRLRIVAEPMEALVTEALLQAVEGGALATLLDAGQAEHVAGLRDEVAAVEAKLELLAEQWAANTIVDVEWKAAREPLADRRGRLLAQLEELRRRRHIDAMPDPLRDAWPALTFDQRRAIVEAIIDQVVVRPAVRGMPKFDPRRIEVRWRA